MDRRAAGRLANKTVGVHYLSPDAYRQFFHLRSKPSMGRYVVDLNCLDGSRQGEFIFACTRKAGADRVAKFARKVLVDFAVKCSPVERVKKAFSDALVDMDAKGFAELQKAMRKPGFPNLAKGGRR